MVGFFRSIHIPLGLLASHDVAVRPVVEEKKADTLALKPATLNPSTLNPKARVTHNSTLQNKP